MPENPELSIFGADRKSRSDRLDHVTWRSGWDMRSWSGIEVDEVAAVTRREQPDVALVGLGDSRSPRPA